MCDGNIISRVCFYQGTPCCIYMAKRNGIIVFYALSNLVIIREIGSMHVFPAWVRSGKEWYQNMGSKHACHALACQGVASSHLSRV